MEAFLFELYPEFAMPGLRPRRRPGNEELLLKIFEILGDSMLERGSILPHVGGLLLVRCLL